MRVYADCYELMSEIFREVWEMGHIVHTHTMQNKNIEDNEDYQTKEVIMYSYCLTSLKKQDYLFFADVNAREWADAEFIERVSEEHINPGEAWKLRKHIWEEFLNGDREFDYSYNHRMFGKIKDVISLLRDDPDSRQGIINIWNDEDYDGIGGHKRVPCTMYYQLLIRNGQLDIIYNQRSADVVTHFGNDVYLAYKLMANMAFVLGIKSGYLYHNIGSLHSYKKDWPKLKTCIEDLLQK